MIKNNLRELMQKKGVTITELHNILNISRPTLTKMANDETDGIRYDTINKLCKFFKISPNELLVFIPFDTFNCVVAPTESGDKVNTDNLFSDPKYETRQEISRIEEENVEQLADLKIDLSIILSFDENDFIYISSEVKYFPKRLFYAAFELQNEDKAKEKEFFKFVRKIDPGLKNQIKSKIADCIREIFMLDYSVDVVIVADFMRFLEYKDIYEIKE